MSRRNLAVDRTLRAFLAARFWFAIAALPYSAITVASDPSLRYFDGEKSYRNYDGDRFNSALNISLAIAPHRNYDLRFGYEAKFDDRNKRNDRVFGGFSVYF